LLACTLSSVISGLNSYKAICIPLMPFFSDGARRLSVMDRFPEVLMLTRIISRHNGNVQCLIVIVRKLLGVKRSQFLSCLKGLARNAVLVVLK
jgi:hypothetical protein